MPNKLKVSRRAKFLNRLLFFITAWLGFGLLYASLNKSILQNMSAPIYGDGSPLMDSYFLEAYTSWPVSILLIAMVAIVCLKRFFISDFKAIVKTNALFLLLFASIASVFAFNVVSPILST